MDSGNFDQWFWNKSVVKILVLGCLTILTIFSVFNFLKFGQSPATISVTGRADISAKADTIKLVVTKINKGVGIPTVIDEGSDGIDRLISVTKGVIGSDVEIKKTFYQITASTTGYSVANAFSLKTDKVEKIDELIKQLYLNGATSVSNVTFESNNINGVEAKLRNNVYADAKIRAELIAKSAGKHLGRVVSIVDDDTNITSTVEDLTNNDGLINISKSASVVYRIW